MGLLLSTRPCNESNRIGNSDVAYEQNPVRGNKACDKLRIFQHEVVVPSKKDVMLDDVSSIIERLSEMCRKDRRASRKLRRTELHLH